jgi:tRNA-specific 2-thiouridylase
VGHLTKEQVRDAARSRRLVTADKHESQDICFIGAGGTAEFLRQEIPEAFHPGDIRHEDGTRLGGHQGLAAYTIGQRKGLGIAWKEPLFVTRVDAATNTLWLGERQHLLVDGLDLRDCTWHQGELPAAGLECVVRLRHRGKPVAARIIARPGTGPGGLPNARVVFAEPQQRAAAGQACVAYDPTMTWCWGGGWISAAADN